MLVAIEKISIPSPLKTAAVMLVAAYVYILGYLVLSKVIGPDTALLALPVMLFLFAYGVVVWIYPEIGLIVALFLIPFEKLLTVNPGGSLTYQKLAIAFAMVIWVLKSIAKKDVQLFKRLAFTPLSLGILLYVTVSFLSVINATYLDLALFQMMRRASNALLYFLIISALFKRSMFDKALIAYALGTYFASFGGLYEIITGEMLLNAADISDESFQDVSTAEGFRLNGVSGDPDFFAGSMAFGVLMMNYLFFRYKKGWQRALFVIMAIQMIVNIMATGSRGGLGLLVIGLGGFLFFSDIKHKLRIAIVALVGGAIAIGLYTLIDPTGATQRYTGSDLGTIVWRIKMIAISTRMALDHPLIGIGPGQFLIDYYHYIVPSSWKIPQFPGSSFFQFWAESGFIAVSVYFAIYYFAFRNALSARLAAITEDDKVLATFGIGAVIGLFFWAWTLNMLENELFWVAFAFVALIYDHIFLRAKREEKLSTNGEARLSQKI